MTKPYLTPPSGEALDDDMASAISPIEEIIEDARNGRPYILVDAEDRENEGDVIIPAQFATPDQINFMARYARGLICLSIGSDRARQLRLPPMAWDNQAGHGTAFTVSIEAREGVTTGISAHDRSHTIAVAIDPTKSVDDIVSPGHVFPLVAKDGGVLVRAGHTEAAVDISRLAGLNPAGVICEIMKDDGSMARLDDLIPFAQKHRLKIGTIRDLIAYRRRHDHMVVRRAEATFTSKWGGQWKAITFYNKATETEQIVLQKGRIEPDQPTLVRMHQMSPLNDMFGLEGPRSDLLARSMEIIGEEGAGIVVILGNRTEENDMLTRLIQHHAGTDVGNMDELRDYGVGAQILAELGVHDMVLLSNSQHSLIALDGYDLAVVGHQPLAPQPVAPQPVTA